jgi:hypothetical protein
LRQDGCGSGSGQAVFGEAVVFVAFALAVFALMVAVAAGASAVILVVVGALLSLGEGREGAALIGLDAELEGSFFEASLLVQAEEVVLTLFGFFGSEPAALGHIRGAGGFGDFEAFTLELVAVFIDGPDGFEDGVGAVPGKGGAEVLAVGRGEGFGDGFFEGGQLSGRVETAGAGEGEGGDLAAVENGVAAGGFDGAGKDALHDLGGEDLDAGEILQEGDREGGAGGADGEAIVLVVVAEVVAEEGAILAGGAFDGEAAAAAEVVGGGRPGGVGFGHGKSPGRPVVRSQLPVVSYQFSVTSGLARALVKISGRNRKASPDLARLFCFSTLSSGYQVGNSIAPGLLRSFGGERLWNEGWLLWILGWGIDSFWGRQGIGA